MKRGIIIFVSFCALVLILFSACNVKVNRSIHIEDGRKVTNSLNAVNGSVYVGSDCVIKGACRSVNGVIEIGSNSKVGSLQAVNGSIDLDEYVEVNGEVESVNGSIGCDRGVEIFGTIISVNGDIDLKNTLVQRHVKTNNGDIYLMDESIIKGNIIVKRNRGNSRRNRRITIEITEDSVVEGDIIVQDPHIHVKVILSRGGEVKGKIENAEVVDEG